MLQEGMQAVHTTPSVFQTPLISVVENEKAAVGLSTEMAQQVAVSSGKAGTIRISARQAVYSMIPWMERDTDLIENMKSNMELSLNT